MSCFQKQSEQFLSDSEDLLELARSEYRIDNDDQLPETDNSLCLWLTDYEGDERDLIWWCGRLKLALELDQVKPITIRVPFTEEDIQGLQSGEHFHWCFEGVNLFIFNSWEHPEYDPDSEEYNSSIPLPL